MSFFENDNQQKIQKELEKRQTHTLWAEKYRPLSLNDFVGNELIKEKAQQYINDNDIPHLLLYGRPGGGKTTLAHILAKNINCDLLYINASSENSVDDVRTKITNFSVSVGFRNLKIVILDESDYLTPNAQAALRNLMETYSQHTRFILTCNYIERIIEPIISRAQTFELIPPSKKEIAFHVNNILRKEGIEATPTDLAFIINSFYPDIRRIINSLQLQVKDKKLSVNKKAMVDSDYKLKIVEILKDSKKDKKESFREIRQLFADNSITDFSDMYRLLYDSIEDYAKGHIAPVILIIADQEYKYSFVVDKEINFMSTIIQILNEVK